MRPEDLLNAMSEIDEDLIARSSKKTRFAWTPVITIAACLLLFLGLGTQLLTARDRKDTLRVAMFYTTGAENSGGYERAAGEALSAFYSDYELQYTYYKDASSEDPADAISTAASEGYELMLLDGRQEWPTLLTVALQYPETTFLALGVSEAEFGLEDLPDNILCIDYKPEIAGYLAGYTAIKEGYTKLGYYYDLGTASYLAYGSGYLQGIEAAATELGIEDRVQVRISSTYTLPKDAICLTADLTRLCTWYEEGTQMILACGELSCQGAESAAEYCKGDTILIDRSQSVQDSQAILSQSIAQMLDSIHMGEFGHTNTGVMPYYTLNDPDGTWGFQNVSEEEFATLRDSLINGSRPCKAEMVTAEECSVEVLFS